jgi:hypothetical protein
VTPPVVVDERGDVTLYRSIESAAFALEPIDVQNGEYVAYDSEGFILTLECQGPRVVIAGRASIQPEPAALIGVLQSFWERAARAPWPATSSVGQAVAQSCERFGYNM